MSNSIHAILLVNRCCVHSGCSLASNDLTNRGKDMSAVIKLAEAFTQMPSLQTVK